MSTATAPKPTNGKPPETTISYVPLGETETITLTLSRVRQFLCVPTKSGKYPSDEQVIKYMMLCKAQSLNPWVNDAYLTGYDSKDGPTFTLITAMQALLKRAEASPDYDGMESGVIVLRDGNITERAGDLVIKGETLVGGWARVHRRDRTIPAYDALNLETFDQQRSRWNADKAGMIVKCAEASALRKAFPSTLAAMYCKEEMDSVRHRSEETVSAESRPKVDRLAAQLIGTLPAAIEHKPGETTFELPTEDERELEPVSKQTEQPKRQSRPVDDRPFIDRLEAASTAMECDQIADDADVAHAKGSLSVEDRDFISGACRDKSKSFGK